MVNLRVGGGCSEPTAYPEAVPGVIVLHIRSEPPTSDGCSTHVDMHVVGDKIDILLGLSISTGFPIYAIDAGNT